MKCLNPSFMFVAAVAAVLLCTGVAAAEPGQIGLSTIPTAEPISVSGSVVRMLGGLFLCIGAFTGGIHLYRKFLLKGPIGGGRRLTILERVSVSQKGSVALVSLDGREFLVTVGPDSPRIVPVSDARGETFAESLGVECPDQELFNA
jgi:flagellar biogenesis protein FliO